MPTEADAVIDAIDRIRKRQNVPKAIHDLIDAYRLAHIAKQEQKYPLLAAVTEACRQAEIERNS